MILDELQLIDVFAMMAPEPTKDDVRYEQEQDRLANPHNDTYKPKRRLEVEIITELKYKRAAHMMKTRRKFLQ